MKIISKIALMLALLTICSVALCACGGGAKSAVEKAATIQAKEKVSLDDYIEAMTNGYLASEMKNLAKLASKIEDNEDIYKDFEDDWAKDYEDLVDYYGKGIKASVKYDDEVDLRNKVLDNYQDTYRGYGETLKGYVKAYNKLDKNDIEDIADDLGLKKSDLESIIKYISSMAEDLRKCDVTDGYDFDITCTVKGADDDRENEATARTIKINGKWISPDAFRTIYNKVLGYLSALTKELK